jgi:hypothetical protein
VKIDLTNLPRPQQVAQVVAYLGKANAAGRTAEQLLDVDVIAGAFKHRLAGVGKRRRVFFAKLLGQAVTVIMAAGAIAQAADQAPVTPSTP